jgi:hypothetical protein
MMKGDKGEQLQMLMPARELKGRIGLSYDTDHQEDLPQMWDRKLTESKEKVDNGGRGAGVYDSLASRGYQGEPLEVRHGDFKGSEDRHDGLRLHDGHHRLAAAADLGLEVPVSHSDAHSDNVSHQTRKKLAAAKGVQTWEL